MAASLSMEEGRGAGRQSRSEIGQFFCLLGQLSVVRDVLKFCTKGTPILGVVREASGFGSTGEEMNTGRLGMGQKPRAFWWLEETNNI